MGRRRRLTATLPPLFDTPKRPRRELASFGVNPVVLFARETHALVQYTKNQHRASLHWEGDPRFGDVFFGPPRCRSTALLSETRVVRAAEKKR